MLGTGRKVERFTKSVLAQPHPLDGTKSLVKFVSEILQAIRRAYKYNSRRRLELVITITTKCVPSDTLSNKHNNLICESGPYFL